MIHIDILEGDEKILSRHIQELCEQSKHLDKPVFSGFLSPREQVIAQTACLNQGTFFGGWPDSQRKMAGFSPNNCEIPEEDFPVSTVEILHQKGNKLAHQSILGSILALGISRDAVGDILPVMDHSFVFCTPVIQKVLCDDLTRIGNTGVSCKPYLYSDIPDFETCFLELTGTIASGRIDALVAFLCKISREKAVEMIRKGMVQVNWQIVEQPASKIDCNTTVTVRGYGKFLFDEIGYLTKKGRLQVKCRKYQ